jgi:anti-sigma factor RsiW
MTKHPSIDEETHLKLRHGEPSANARLADLAARDPLLAAREAEWERQDAALRALYGPIAEEPLPARYRALIDGANTEASVPGHWRMIAAALALLAIGVAGGWSLATIQGSSSAGTALAQEALRAHETYVTEVAHPVEVRAADERHLVTWLSRRLGHPIAVPNLTAHGYTLMGGRVVPEDHGAAALMMYEDGEGRRLTLYVARAPGGKETAFRFLERDGVRAFWWIDEDLGCAVIGDLPKESLRAIAVSAYDQLI